MQKKIESVDIHSAHEDLDVFVHAKQVKILELRMYENKMTEVKFRIRQISVTRPMEKLIKYNAKVKAYI